MRKLETLEILGGAWCLDFVNTINSRHEPEHDYLRSYSDLAGWAVKVGILSTSQQSRLLEKAEKEAQVSKRVLETALIKRELIYRLFSKTAQGSEPEQKDIKALAEFYAEAISHSIFVKKDEHYLPDWSMGESYETILWPLIYSAGQLLLSKELIQVKECPGCGWLFLDKSKNQSRRWCSMSTCGARDKMRRYHRRLRTE